MPECSTSIATNAERECTSWAKDKHLLFIINDLSFIVSHRLPILRAAARAGFKITIAAPHSKEASFLKNEGFNIESYTLSRWGWNPLVELRSIKALNKIIKMSSPDIIHNITIKPVLYGTLTGALIHKRAVVNTLPGLGYVFTSRGVGATLRRLIVTMLYRRILPYGFATLVQNKHDLKNLALTCGITNTHLIRGSGVNINEFSPSTESERVASVFPPSVLLPARLLRSKGVSMFVEAARLVKKASPKAVRFLIAGESPHAHPDRITEEEISIWRKEGIVEFLGFQSDIASLMKQASIVCLPSSYGEGLPKILLEAAASGKPVVATTIPGCEEVVKEGITGYLVAPGDSLQLADAILRLLNDPMLCKTMGRAGRELIIKEQLNEDKISELTLEVYKSALDLNL